MWIRLFFDDLFVVPPKKPVTFMDWLFSFVYIPPVKESFFDWFWTIKKQEALEDFWHNTTSLSLLHQLYLLTAIFFFLRWLWSRLLNMKCLTTVFYHMAAFLMSLLGSFTSIWIFFEKLFLPPPKKEMTFFDWIYSMFSTPPEKTFVDWFYTDRQKSPLAFWQDSSFWSFFWFVILLPVILDFLVFWFWRNLQGNNWNKEKLRSPCCLPKLPSVKMPNQDKDNDTLFDTGAHFKDQPVAARSLLKDLEGMTNQSTNPIMKSVAVNCPRLVLRPRKVCQTIHSWQPRPCAASCSPTLSRTVASQVVRVISFTRQMTGGERKTQRIKFRSITVMNSFASGKSSYVDITVLEIVRSSYRIPSEYFVKMLQLMMAPKVDDQKQLFKSEHSRLAFRDVPQAEKPILKKRKLGNNWNKEKLRSPCCLPKLPSVKMPNQDKDNDTLFDAVAPFKDGPVAARSLSKDVEKMTNQSTNCIVNSVAVNCPRLVLRPHKVCQTIHSWQPLPCSPSCPPTLLRTVASQVVRVIRFIRQMTGGERLVFTQQIKFCSIMVMNSFASGKSSYMDIKVMEIVSSSYRIPIEDSVEMLQLMMAPKVDDQKQLFKSEHSLLAFRDIPRAEKSTLKKQKLVILRHPKMRKHPELICDMKKVTEKYWNGNMTISELENTDEVFIDIMFQEGIVNNWFSVDGFPPPRVRLCFTLSKYIYGKEPSVEIFVPNKEDYFINLFLIESMLKTFLISRWKRMNVPRDANTNMRSHITLRFLKGAKRFFKSTFDRNHKKRKKIPVQESTYFPLSEQGLLLEAIHHVTRNAEALRGLHVLFDSPYISEDKVLESIVFIRDTCNSTSQRMRGPVKAEIEVLISAEVLDLLLAITLNADNHAEDTDRSVVIPYPKVVDPKNPNALAFHPGNRKNCKKFIKTLRRIPSPMKMAKWSFMEMKKHLKKKHPLAFPLLKWVIESVEIPIMKLPINQQLPFMCTHHQFLFLTAPSEREAEFRSARRKYGSSFAFHGSKIGNWHSIIRQGLFVYSYTKNQKNGAVFGPGIYTSPFYHIACGYSFILCQQNTKTKPSQSNNDQLLMEQPIIKCIALCEVIKSDSLKKRENVWVVSNPNHICIRLLFVYQDEDTAYSVNTQDIQTENAILNIMNTYMHWL